MSVKRGSPIILDCGLGDTTTLIHFYWAKVNGTIDLTSGNFEGDSQDSPMLTIYHSEAINAGLYYCVAGNVVKEVSSPFIQLIVFGQFHRWKGRKEGYKIERNQTVIVIAFVLFSFSLYEFYYINTNTN